MSRLIDADEFKLENKKLLHCDFPYLSEVTLEELIDDAPTVDAVPVVNAKWVKKEKIFEDGTTYSRYWWYECSNCGEKPLSQYNAVIMSDYCPWCGAKMDEVTE